MTTLAPTCYCILHSNELGLTCLMDVVKKGIVETSLEMGMRSWVGMSHGHQWIMGWLAHQ